jgi:predicted TIM-barrel fold metal-dependent hydrolase
MSQPTILDADGHIVEDHKAIAELLPSPYRGSGNIYHLGSLFPPLDHFHASPVETPFNPRKQRRPVGPAEWEEFLEDVGIQATVLYPTVGLSYGNVTDVDWAIALARAYNDWLHQAYLERSPRFKGIALIPLQDTDAAVAELRRAVTELGMVGGMLPSNGLGNHLGSRRFWPVYAEADRLGCALAVHGGNHGNYGFDDFNRYAPVHALGHPLGQLIALGGLVFNGVFDRYPNARFGFMEGGIGWFLMALERFDRSHETHAQLDPRGEFSGPKPDEKVSAYIRRHVDAGRIYIGCEGEEPTIGTAVKLVGNKPFVFSSDFPHEVNNVFCKHEIQEVLEHDELSDEDKVAILGGNAARFYRITPPDRAATPAPSAATA